MAVRLAGPDREWWLGGGRVICAGIGDCGGRRGRVSEKGPKPGRSRQVRVREG